MEVTFELPTAPQPANSDVVESQRLYQCTTCKRAFTRVDHLTRHVRSHTRQKPYVCSVCTKGFSRVDLLKRHTTNHKADNANTKPRRSDVARPSRAIQACEACAQNHLRCEDVKPCSRCQKKGTACNVPASSNQVEPEDIDMIEAPPHTDGDHEPSATSIAIASQHDHAGQTTERYTSVDDDATATHEAEDFGFEPTLQPIQNISAYSQPSNEFPLSYDANLPDNDDYLLPDYLRMMPSLSGTATPRGIMDTSFNWDVQLNDLDFGFLNQYSAQAPFNASTPSTDAAHHIEQQWSTATSNGGVNHRAAAFRRSVWRYQPQSSKDFAAAEQHNLAMSATERHDGHASPVSVPRRAIEEPFNLLARDNLLSLVLSTCDPKNLPKIASAFPSIELLDSLIQYFLSSPPMQAKEWLHLPTLSISSMPPTQMAALIAAGAVSTPDLPLRKLGFALHEAARAGNARSFEEDNSVIRHLETLQTFEIQLEIGMWSGISRKMEIAESFLQPLVTMLRRGGRFRRSTYSEIAPQRSEEGAELDAKWRRWVQQESFVRLVFRTFQLDRESSMSLLKPPLISYAEMELPVPCGDELWLAPSATSWKATYLALSNERHARPSPKECVGNLECLHGERKTSVVFLHMIWGMIWEFRQMSSVTGRKKVQANNSLIMASRQQELTNLLEDFRVNSSAVEQSNSSTTETLLELMLMHIHVTLEELQLFAGLEGQEEALRVYPELRDWVATQSARQALFHASQVIRVARRVPKGALRGFNAIAVYHASLVCWTYGLLDGAGADATVSGGSQARHSVRLDGSDTLDVRRFITLDRGTPVIQQQDEKLVPINDTSGTMNVLLDLLRSNHAGTGGTHPPLVENLVQLMEGLQSATK